MRIPNFLNRHNRFARLADAYIDGELVGGAGREFEGHLAACTRCRGAVALGQSLKLSVLELAIVEAPRSFRLTPAMVARAAPAPVRASTPMYLSLARVGAALSVVAFASVLAAGALGSSSSSDSNASGTASRQSDGDFQYEAAGASPAENEPEKLVPMAATQAAGLPPATGGQVISSGVATASPEATPPAPSTGRSDDSSVPPELAPVTDSANPTTNEALSSVALDTALEDGASRPWALILLGIVAGGFVLALAGLEGSRRLRRA